MNEELNYLLDRYEKDELTAEERKRLGKLLTTKEGRLQALASNYPEAIFLADVEVDIDPSKEDSYWSEFDVRLSYHGLPVKPKPKWGRWVAAAAVVVLIGFTVFNIVLSKPPGAETEMLSDTETLVHQLRHRLPAEILPKIRAFMSEKGEISINQQRNEIEITDRTDNIETLERALVMLDRQPKTLKLKLSLMFPRSPGAAAIQQAGRSPVKDFDFSKYRINKELIIVPTEGRMFRTILENRYEITCFTEVNLEATEINIVNISIYDQEVKEIIYIGNSLVLSDGLMISKLTEHKNESGEDLILAISLENINQ